VKSLVEGAVVGLIKSFKSRKTDKSTPAALSKLATPELPFQSFDSTTLRKRYGAEWESRLTGAISEPAWVTNIPREFYDFEDARTGKWENYDLFVPGYGEILSGAKREWEYAKILAKLERDGVRKENYKVILELAKEGRLKPSAGAGIGIERLIGWMLGAEHVGEIQPFPRVPGTVYDL
jgi:asparaginyl-tRNA synthetase